jgi:hypothetical protein
MLLMGKSTITEPFSIAILTQPEAIFWLIPKWGWFIGIAAGTTTRSRTTTEHDGKRRREIHG